MSKNYTKYMHRVELSGTVQWDPIINHQERDGVQLTKASYVIVTENGFDENGREIREYVSVEAQGRRGQDVEQFLKKDMTVRILGRVRRSSTLTRKGEKVWTNKILVMKQYFEGSCDGTGIQEPEAEQELPERSGDSGDSYTEHEYFQ